MPEVIPASPTVWLLALYPMCLWFSHKVFLICKALVPVLIDSSITRYLILDLSAVIYREHTTHESFVISKTYDYVHYGIYDTKTREIARVIAFLLFSSGI